MDLWYSVALNYKNVELKKSHIYNINIIYKKKKLKKINIKKVIKITE